MKGVLVLENGRQFRGELIGSSAQGYGEVVFHTGMTGYQEILTDPSYAGQIVAMTYPLIGNYGINEGDFEAKRPWLTGFVTGEACDSPSHFRSKQTLHDYLTQHGITGLIGVNTRALVRTIREEGSLKGYILSEASLATASALEFPALPRDLVKRVSTQEIYRVNAAGDLHVVLVDFGAKGNIAKSLARLGCQVTVVPANTSFEKIAALHPDGIMLSNGPGDPADCADVLPLVKKLAETYPLFGICLGHQLLAMAFGAKTAKMSFGHRGSNHPVQDLQTGKVWITSQNHGYSVQTESLPAELLVTHQHVNDGTIEGVAHKTWPAFSVQFHPEACPGPQDAEELFHRFLARMNERKGSQLVSLT
ncbi:carbamoyl phosphate synthase small subunit [Tumebacillus algifaecis]|uniref:Carbamoyl phosphate synthase small chain n=1 Tax=Tumebacillus algifaecis TaxID=1214604 RepID=A0A223D4S8_9BACL|nr:carbamoyl phosphate synthase small subunit [Tumebacillus algifaecis]ASS76602.1 carbamoyl phosphate synthase small subunit [Tumebacillus algifaecis]